MNWLSPFSSPLIYLLIFRVTRTVVITSILGLRRCLSIQPVTVTLDCSHDARNTLLSLKRSTTWHKVSGQGSNNKEKSYFCLWQYRWYRMFNTFSARACCLRAEQPAELMGDWCLHRPSRKPDSAEGCAGALCSSGFAAGDPSHQAKSQNPIKIVGQV